MSKAAGASIMAGGTKAQALRGGFHLIIGCSMQRLVNAAKQIDAISAPMAPDARSMYPANVLREHRVVKKVERVRDGANVHKRAQAQGAADEGMLRIPCGQQAQGRNGRHRRPWPWEVRAPSECRHEETEPRNLGNSDGNCGKAATSRRQGRHGVSHVEQRDPGLEFPEAG
eukprot:CAMPEP_0198612470 /NCGR_PEP_ID=MMETSP1462-20131121/157910_1 /TAXON_ID=1333877 /ORGANISM="Brandtodinium nutriculum, Strain RCC3387" /LENGTH=170 /DNA_ID=CAMNT_0044344271 /DNA_START=806 /DNA_END=1320 /DNA_ORIENTATION=+